MVRQMYEGAEFSPDAFLAAPMTVDADSLTLNTTAWLPPAPNIAIINDPQYPEVVLYTTKTSTTLGGLVRGVSRNGVIGTAHSHDANLAVYCGDTAYAKAAQIENIRYLFGQQVIGIEWDVNSDDATALKLIDVNGKPIESLPFESFDNHRTYADIRRCVLSKTGVPTYGSNARGDGLTLDGSAGNVMVAIPKFWAKAYKPEPGKYAWLLSPFPVSGFEVFPAFMQRGGIERDYIYVSAYEAALLIRDHPNHTDNTLVLGSKTDEQPITGGGAIKIVAFSSGGTSPFVFGETLTGSTSGTTAKVVDWAVTGGSWAAGSAVGTLILKEVSGNFQGEDLLSGAANRCTIGGNATAVPFTLEHARIYAENTAPGWGIQNPWTRAAIILLQIIEYQSWNLQGKLGRGIVDLDAGAGFAGKPTGADGANSNIGVNGTGTGTGENGKTPVVWRGIENPWGNTATLTDGLTVTTPAGYIEVAPRAGKERMGVWLYRAWERSTGTIPAVAGYISGLLFEPVTKYLFLPGEANGAAGTYLCDKWRPPQSNNGVIAAGGHWSSGDEAGPMAVDCYKTYLSENLITTGTRIEYIGPEGVETTATIRTAELDSLNYPPPVTDASSPTSPYAAWSDNSNGGTKEWIAPMKIVRQDGGATITGAGAGLTHLLKAQGYGFNIPVNARIVSIAVDVYRYVIGGDSSNYVIDASVNLIKPGGALSADNKAWIGDVYKWTGTMDALEISRYGDSTGTLWNEVWTPEMINHGDFGAAISATVTGPNAKPAIDFVGIRVTYQV